MRGGDLGLECRGGRGAGVWGAGRAGCRFRGPSFRVGWGGRAGVWRSTFLRGQRRWGHGWLGRDRGVVDRARGGRVGKEKTLPVHRHLHLLLVVRNRAMDVFELQANLRLHVPAQRAAQHARAEIIHPILRVAEHDGKVLGDVVQQHMQRMQIFGHRRRLKQTVVEDVAVGIGVREREIHRVARTKELQGVFHNFLAAELAAGEVLQDRFAVFGVEGFALGDAGDVRLLELEPPIGLHVAEGCEGF